ncbi:transcriptional regulator tac1 [Phtheirospermum japonicum]|uniref:Transcriptional regulator tac1 n=1 Tax=Phtheirospermum japonicum TaxID=374723 RepID=A0A830CCC8_9LAMI|nr:transcriptional regulator tac1 [Phtheirospermum japonicum]
MSKKNHILTESNNYHRDRESIHSNEENSDLGVGRLYECVFCRRGFNTAQALGGHMNIHRKDNRAGNNKPNHNASKKVLLGQVNYHHQTNDGPRLYQQMIIPGAYSSSSSSSSYNGYNMNYGQSANNHREPLMISPGDWPMGLGLGLECPPLINGQEELDLELRLGYES